jgi:hypothetical protein
MPRVVPDQREKFDNDDLFRKLSRESEVRYTGHMDKSLAERQMLLRSDCTDGQASIAFVNTGINLPLRFESNAWSSQREHRRPTPEFVDLDTEPGKVHLKSQFIMNGVCVVWRGWLDLYRLDGTARLEFDDERAMVEDAMLRQQIEQYNATMGHVYAGHHHHHHQQLHQSPSQHALGGGGGGGAADMDVVQALLDIATPVVTTAAMFQ